MNVTYPNNIPKIGDTVYIIHQTIKRNCNGRAYTTQAKDDKKVYPFTIASTIFTNDVTPHTREEHLACYFEGNVEYDEGSHWEKVNAQDVFFSFVDARNSLDSLLRASVWNDPNAPEDPNRKPASEGYKKYFLFLDDLRRSGVTNMFGAAPYLLETFPELANDTRAGEILVMWMESFDDCPKAIRKEGV